MDKLCALFTMNKPLTVFNVKNTWWAAIRMLESRLCSGRVKLGDFEENLTVFKKSGSQVIY